MAEKVKARVAIPIGLDMVHVAKLTSDTAGGAAVYEDPKYLARALKVTVTPITVNGLLESDDGIEIYENEITGYQISFEASQLSDEMRAYIFGHKLDEDGGIITSRNDKPPILALIFRSLLSDKVNYKNCILYKGSFKPNASEYESAKRDSKTYKTETVEGTFYARDCDGNIKYDLRSDNSDASAEKINNWFTKVQEPGTIKGATTPTEPAQS